MNTTTDDDSKSGGEPPRGARLRQLKARAQGLEPVVRVGKAGVSPQFMAALETALEQHQLVKMKFDEFKARKKVLAPQIAEKTRSHLIQRVGNVAVFYRPSTDANALGKAED